MIYHYDISFVFFYYIFSIKILKRRSPVFMSKYEMDMCSGPLLKKLIIFSAPLMLSGMLQLLFNAMDTIVVGRWSGSEALAAVGSTSSLNVVIMNLFIGITIGANVLAARYYASHDFKKLSDTVHTAILTGILSGFMLLAAGVLISRPALELMGSPENVIDLSTLYMKIYFCGMPFFMVYNFGAAILRATGDTRRPLYYLIAAGITNICLNLIFVIKFNMGVAGVAIATVISQVLSCSLVVRLLIKTDGPYHLDLKKLRINWCILGDMLRIGVPAGLQSMLINFSNVLIQSSVNSFGSLAMAGYAAALNVNSLLYMAVNAITQACLNFTSQNYGVGNTKRIDHIILLCVAMDLVIGTVLGVLSTVFGESILGIYSTDSHVIAYGMEDIIAICLPYALCGVMDTLPGAIRGMNYSTIPMFITLTGVCLFRIFWIYTIFPMHRTLTNLFLSFPASWIITIIMQTICLFIVRAKVKKRFAVS